MSKEEVTQDRWHAVNIQKQDAQRRIFNFEEVALGYTEEQAQKEASRCLMCATPQFSKGCPVGINIPGFIRLIKEKKYNQALKRIKEKSSFPVLSSRICPQEEQCQKSCMLSKKGDAVQIGRLERFVADLEQEDPIVNCSIRPALSTGKKIAVIGSGPSGLYGCC